MAQENRHLTTEQLSAYLDEQQPSAGELLLTSQLDAHLKTCEQCQQELADLRRTVALLHALPRPALPRSFVLPLDIQTIDDHVEDEVEEIDRVPVALAAAYSRMPDTSTVKQTRRWPTYVRATLRTVSAIAAVIGLALFLSGALASFPHGVTTTGSYSSASQATSATDSTQNANVATSKSANSSDGTAKPQRSPSSRATITPPVPTATAEATPITAIRQAADTPVANGSQSILNAREPAQSQPPTILFFDLSTGPGRLGFGFLLLLLGVMGYVVFKRRWRQERA